MLIKKPDNIPSNEITPLSIYLNRRNFMRAGLVAASTIATGWVYRKLNYPTQPPVLEPELANLVHAETNASTQSSTTRPSIASGQNAGFTVNEPKTPYDAITHYNNFYEFSTDKDGVAPAAAGFVTRPWSVVVDGLVRKPTTFDLDDLMKIAPPQERVYRMRCVEAWSMVIPWDGFSLSKLLDRVEPLSTAKFVAFQTLLDPKRMPNQNTDVLQWPYVEGLRMNEAMHPLTILATGIYGRTLPPQDGAPVRLVIPWKYGFKGIKSIVKISLVGTQPPTTWSGYAPNEYGFYANVNPKVDHPRWSQATEQRIGDYFRRPTLMFNGYADQVASMYAGMDLHTYY